MSRGWNSWPSQTGFIEERDTPRMATSGALMIGVNAVPPIPPRLEIEMQPPWMSCGFSLPSRARPLTSPDWLGGALVISDVIQISYIRIAIFVLALIFLGLILYVLKRTRLGLEVRAVTQNPGMAASMGINPDRINMLTFGLGSGIAGIAGVAIGLYAKVTSELGSDYIVQSFMTVVVGGVGNIWGTLLGATMIGNLQKLIEWFNPSNTLAAQTYMILFIILFIQFRPKGIIALKGRAAEA